LYSLKMITVCVIMKMKSYEKGVSIVIRIAICDDMPEFLSVTKTLVSEWKRPDHLFLEVFEDGDALINAHTAKPFDIILLDVVMPLLNGIGTAAEIRKNDTAVKIVFLTVSPEYAVDSYTVKADNYLLKPLEREKLHQCLDELYTDIQTSAKSITAKAMSAVHRIKLRDIEYIEAQRKENVFFLRDGSTIKVTDSLYTYEEKLLLEDGFFKCHRSYIVNIHWIKSYTHNEITMQSGYRIPISRSHHKEFEAAYFELLFGRESDQNA